MKLKSLRIVRSWEAVTGVIVVITGKEWTVLEVGLPIPE